MSEHEKQQAARRRLVAFAIEWLAHWCGEDPGPLLTGLPTGAAEQLQGYRNLLSAPWSPTQPGTSLLSIFSRVKLERSPDPPQRYWPAVPLSLKKLTYPVGKDEAQGSVNLWPGFKEDWARLPDSDSEHHFETFTHLLHKWTWAVPCSYGEPGVSLYDEFRSLSALVHASNCAEKPESKFLLVGGDIPGIQDFVYTITSKGAAKGLRGRSFFVQLLGDAVVRRLLADLGLPEANVIYAAGGNFMVLAPAGKETEEAVDRVLRQVNSRLVEAIQGDTALVLEMLRVTASDLFTAGRFKDVRDEFAKRIAQAKNKPLRELAGDWVTLFEPKGKGSRLSCAVCRIEVDEHNSKPLERTGEVPEEAERPRICYLCDSFAELARNIRHENLWMMVTEKPEMLGTEVEPRDGWTDLLARMTGFDYKFSDRPPEGKATVLALNCLDFLAAEVHGFRLLANVTPVVTDDDLEYLREEEKVAPRDMDSDMPYKEDIRSFTLLAHAAATAGAIERVGVLRMDVDGLGWVFSEGVPDLTLPKLGALSAMMERFFGGYLNALVKDQADNDLYIIYAGGDDLFIVGDWHHLPDLAEAIRNQFTAFTGENPVLSLSGGITLEGAKFPLYRAAERAGDAEGKAKGYTRPDNRKKDALCFLDTVVGWEDWKLVREQKNELLWLVGARDNPEGERRLPRALLQVIQSIHQLYRTGLWHARRRVRRKNRQRPADKKLPLPKPQMFFGRWTWMQAYSLVRMARRSKEDEAKTRIVGLQRALMNPSTVRYSGLAARWAEYLTRRHLEPWRKRLKLDERV